jgi:hypothetical protein
MVSQRHLIVTVLEMTSITVKSGQPIMGVLRVKLCEQDNLDVVIRLEALGASQLDHFKRLGELSYLENAISNWAMAVELTDERHPDKPGLLSHLGITQLTRFESLGDISDLHHAISSWGSLRPRFIPAGPKFLSGRLTTSS